MSSANVLFNKSCLFLRNRNSKQVFHLRALTTRGHISIFSKNPSMKVISKRMIINMYKKFKYIKSYLNIFSQPFSSNKIKINCPYHSPLH